MSETKAEYKTNCNLTIRSEVYLAAQRLSTFCTQLNAMSEIEKEACIKRASNLNHDMLIELYNALTEIKNKGSI